MEKGQKILAIDYGLGTFGLAVSSQYLSIIQELPNLSANQGFVPAGKLQQLLTSHNISIVVLGLPISNNAAKFNIPLIFCLAEMIKSYNSAIQVFYVDEYLTSKIFKTHSGSAANFIQMFLTTGGILSDTMDNLDIFLYDKWIN